MSDSDAEIKAKIEILRKLRERELVLEDCPFCGSPASYRIYNATYGHMAVGCNGVDLKCAGHKCGGVASPDWQGVIDGWNRRDGK